MGIRGIRNKGNSYYNKRNVVLFSAFALALFFSVASIVLQPSYQDSHQKSGTVVFPFELCPVQPGVYYNDWIIYGNPSPLNKQTAVCDKISGDYNPATGITRNDAKKFNDFKFATIPPIPDEDIISVSKVTLTAQAKNLGANDNKLDFMMFTGTKSADWLTLRTFSPISTLDYSTYILQMPKNPKTNLDWSKSDVKTWVNGGKTMAFGLNEQLRQNSGKINVGTYRATVEINAAATLSFNTDRYPSNDVANPVLLTLDGPANLGSVTVNLHSTSANANLSVILSETSPGIYTNQISLGPSPSPTQLAVSLDGDVISMSFLTLTVSADVLPDGVALGGYLGSPGSATLPIRWHETREYTMTQGASIDVYDTSVPTGTNTVSVTATSYQSDGTTLIASKTLTATRIGTTSTFTTSPLLAFSLTAPADLNALILQVASPSGGLIKATRGSNFDNAQVLNDAVTVPLPNTPYVPDPIIRQNCSQLGGDTDGDGICNDEEPSTGLRVPLAEGCTVSAGVYTCTYYNPKIYWTLPCNSNAVYSGATGSQFNDPLGAQVCPDVNKKDIYVYYNWGKFHKPSTTALSNVVTAFANSGVPNTGSTPGIRLHFITGVQTPHIDTLFYNDPPGLPDIPDLTYIELKNLYFLSPSERLLPPQGGLALDVYLDKLSEAKRQVVKHMYSTHLNGELVGSTGYAERPGDDFFISLGSAAYGVGSISQQERTIMHELGHTLGLRHACDTGSNGAINGEPNCPSVMNYLYQFLMNDGGIAPVAGVTPGTGIVTSPVDYSPYPYTTIPERTLTDQFKVSHGLSAANARSMVVGGCAPTSPTSYTCNSTPTAVGPRYVNTNTVFDWNNSGGALTGTGTVYPFNVHYFTSANVPGIQDISVSAGMGAIREWSYLSYSHVGSAGFDLGVINLNGNDDVFQGPTCGPLDPETLAFEVDAGPDQAIFEGEPYTLNGNIIDPHFTQNVDVRVTNGDGTPDFTTNSPAGSIVFPDHIYDTVGEYIVTLTASKVIVQPSCVSGEPDFTYPISVSDTTTVTVNPKGHIIVDKVTNPSGDPQSFTFTTTGIGYAGFSLTDAAAPNDQKLVPGTYSVAETIPGGWDLTSSCSSDQIGDTSTPNSIDLQGGETVTCTFTNTKRGHIIVDKVTNPSGDPQSFTFITTGIGYAGFSLTDAAAPNDQELVPGTYSVVETTPPAGWYQTSVTCSDGSDPSAINLTPGEIVTCTFENANLVVVFEGPVVEANNHFKRTLPLKFTVTAGIGGPIITTQTPQLYVVDFDGDYHPITGYYDVGAPSDTGVYLFHLNLDSYPNGIATAFVVLDDGSETDVEFFVDN